MHIHPDLVVFAIVLIVIFGLTFRIILTRRRNQPADIRWMETIKYLGQISIALGVVLQSLELMRALDAVEVGGAVTMDKFASGLKSTMYATVHGLLVYIIAMIILLVLRLTERREAR